MAIPTLRKPPDPAPGATRLTRSRLPRATGWAIPGLALAGVGVPMAWAGANLALAAVTVAALTAAVTWLAARLVEGRRQATDRLVTVLVTSAFLVALTPLISVVVTVVTRGAERFDAMFFNNSMRGIVGEGGGAYHALLGTLIVTGLAAAISIPVGLLAAIYLVEYGKGRLATALRFFVDVMTGIPSIVAGLFAYSLFVLFFGPGVRLGIAGSVALSVLMIPVVVRSTEEILKIVPNELREAAYALGVPRWRTIVKVVLPTAVGGIVAGVTLAIARVAGETAPLLLTVGTISGTNLNPFDGRMATLPVYAYYGYVSPGVPRQPSLDRAWAAALTLILIVMALNLLGRLVARLLAPKVR